MKSLDKKNQKEYNIKTVEGGEHHVERSDEFRRIQAESMGLSDEDVRMFHRGGRILDEGVRGRLSRVFRRELVAECSRVGYTQRTLVNKKSNQNFTIYGNVDADTFHDIFQIVHQYLRNGDAVDIHDKEYYRDCRNYLTEDGLSGFSITADGDLISVFNLGQRGFLRSIRDYVREQGAISLDCYQSETQALADIYATQLGFKTASILDFNYDVLVEDRGKEYADYFVETYGEAPVHFMVLTDETVETKHFEKDDYVAAVRHQRSFLQSRNNGTKEILYSKRGYQPRDYSQITQEEYEHHAWAMVNGVLSANESGLFMKKIGEKKLGTRFIQAADGSYMVSVGENGVENKIVFTDGNWEAPSIDCVFYIKANDETSIDIVRGFIYESKGIIDTDYFNGLLEIYNAEDFQYGAQRNGSKKNGAIDAGSENGSGTFGEVRHSRRVTDSKGRELSPEQVEFFAGTKAVDKHGNLKVVYHGTKEDYGKIKNSRRINRDGRDENGTNHGDKEESATATLYRKGRGSISVRLDDGRVCELREIVKDGKRLEEISNFAEEIYTTPRTNNESISKGYISDGLSSKLRDGYDHDRGRSLRRELGEELSSDTREPEHHEKRISGEVRHSRRVTDSKGRELSPEQVEFFAGTKAVDKYGNLKVVYHGTEGEFYTFDKSFRGRSTNVEDVQLGFFFTDKKTVARGYALTAQLNRYDEMVWDPNNYDIYVKAVLMIALVPIRKAE